MLTRKWGGALPRGPQLCASTFLKRLKDKKVVFLAVCAFLYPVEVIQLFLDRARLFCRGIKGRQMGKKGV